MLLSERPQQLRKTFGISVYLRCNSAVYSGWDNSKERGGSLSQIREMEGAGVGPANRVPPSNARVDSISGIHSGLGENREDK